MIKLTNPHGRPIWVNPDRMYTLAPQYHEGEATGYTTIHVPGGRVTVKESCEEIAEMWGDQ